MDLLGLYERMAIRVALRYFSIHATPATGANIRSWSLHSYHEKVADRISDQFHQGARIDPEHEDD